MTHNLVIDADSLLYTSCYRHQLDDGCKLELAYMDFVGTIYNIKSAMWKQLDLQKDDELDFHIVFSPKHTFRHELTDTYKANRPPTTIIGISQLKRMVKDRIGAIEVALMEADDIVITMAYEMDNVVIACIDKDIYTHSPVMCFNYKRWEWIGALSQEEIEDNYWIQALEGDSTDGIKGAKGVGIKGAEELVYDMFEPFTYEKYVDKFDSEDHAILSMRLVRMDQYKKGELVLWQNH